MSVCRRRLHRSFVNYCIVVACTCAVSYVRLTEIVRKILAVSPRFIEVCVVLTRKAEQFFSADEIRQSMPAGVDVYTFEPSPVDVFTDDDEWKNWNPLLHVDLCRWADMLIIAPLDSMTMSRAVDGTCANLLSCVLRAWDPRKPIFYIRCKLMARNSHVELEQPTSTKNRQELDERGYTEITCAHQQLCGDGCVPSPEDIADFVHAYLKEKCPLVL